MAPGIAILALAVGLAGCNTPGLVDKPIVAAPPKPEPTMDQARELAMSGTPSIGGDILVKLQGDGSGHGWRTGAQGVFPVAWTVVDTDQVAIDRAKRARDPSTTLATIEQQIQKDGQAAQERRQRGLPPTYQICVELPVTLGLTSGRKRCIFARDWKTQSSTVPAPAAPATAG